MTITNIMSSHVSTWWASLSSGNILGTVVMPFTDMLGIWFFGIIMFLGCIMIFMKMRDVSSSLIVLTLVSGIMLPLMATEYAGLVDSRILTAIYVCITIGFAVYLLYIARNVT